MVSPSLRLVFCVLVGLFTGSILGALFVPDPTGPLAFGLGVLVAGIVAWGLYRSDWLREHPDRRIDG